MPTTTYTTAVAALSGILGHWDMASSSMTTFSGSLGAFGLGSSPGTFGSSSIVPGDPTNLSVAGKTVRNSTIGQMADTAALDLTTAVTIGAWIKPEAVYNAQILFGKADDSARNYLLSFSSTNIDFYTSLRQSQSPWAWVVPGNSYFVVGTYDGAEQRLYVNGTRVITDAQTGAMTANAHQLVLGSGLSSGLPVSGLVGALQHPFLCNAAATDTQIRNLYEIGSATAAEQAGLSIQAMPWSRVALASDANRRYAILTNASDYNVWVTKGSTAVRGGGVLLPAYGGRAMIKDYTGAVSLITDAYVGGKTVAMETG